MNGSRILFVNRFYWPDEPATAQLLTDLAEALAASGHAITVIASHPGTADLPLTETRNGVEIVRVRGSRLGKRHLVGRALDFATFSLGALKQLRRKAKPDDVVVVMSDPPLLGYFATRAAQRRGARVVHWVQDIHPEVAMEVATKMSWLGWLRPLRDAGWKRADLCVTLGSDMAAFIRSRGIEDARIALCPNWAPHGLAPRSRGSAAGLRTNLGLHGKFIVTYSGNLGRVHDLDPILDVAERLRNESIFAFLFIGSGAQRDRLAEQAAMRGLENVFFRPPQPREQLNETLGAADVHLVTLRPGCERYVFPSKLYGITAVARPVVFIGPPDSEIAAIVRNGNFGSAFGREEISALADALRELESDGALRTAQGQAAHAFYLERGQLTHACASWTGILAKLTSTHADRKETARRDLNEAPTP